MGNTQRVAYAVITGLVMASVGNVYGQKYPAKPVRVLTSPAGGGSDFAARLIAGGISGPLGQPVVVENRSGETFAAEAVSKSAPDGHTLLYYGSALWILPLMRRNIPYDVMKDFAPVSLGVSQFSVLVVHPSLPVKSVKNLIALAKARPRALNYASGAPGGSNHLAAELFKSMARVDIVGIPYKSTGPAVNALLGGEIQVMFNTAPTAMPHVKSGRMRALAITAAQPSAVYAELPTISAAGLPGYEAVQMSGLFAPAQTPKAIIDRLYQETARVLERPDMKEKFTSAGVEAVGSTPDQFAATIKAEMIRMGKVIREAAIGEP